MIACGDGRKAEIMRLAEDGSTCGHGHGRTSTQRCGQRAAEKKKFSASLLGVADARRRKVRRNRGVGPATRGLPLLWRKGTLRHRSGGQTSEASASVSAGASGRVRGVQLLSTGVRCTSRCQLFVCFGALAVVVVARMMQKFRESSPSGEVSRPMQAASGSLSPSPPDARPTVL